MNVVLHHGLFGFATAQFGPLQVEYFKEIQEALSPTHRVFTTGVNPVGSVCQRAKQLAEDLDQRVFVNVPAGERIVIIAHSMGGLDARRFLFTCPASTAARIAALVTVATPHRGSPVADLVTQFNQVLNPLHIPDPLTSLGGAVRSVAAGTPLAHMVVPAWLAWLGLDHQAIPDLTTAACAGFNQLNRNRGGIRYFWIAADCTGNVPVLFQPSYDWIAHDDGVAGGPNDGLVSRASAEPPQDAVNPWQTLGTWEGIDHLNAVNMRLPNDPSRPDVAPRYRDFCSQIAKMLGL